MKVRLSPKPPRELYPTDILFQTTYWGTVKSLLGWTPYAFEIDSAGPRRDVLVIVKPVAPDTLTAFVPKGPELAPCTDKYGPFLEALSESLAERLEVEVAFIRYDLPWESAFADELRQRQWYDHPHSRIREMRMNFGTEHWNLRKAPVDMTVADSCVICLDGSEEQWLSRMKPKTRYNIRLAERHGVQVEMVSLDHLPTFYALYFETALRHGFPGRDYRYFEALFAAHDHHPDSSDVRLLLATHGGEAIAGAILIISEQAAVYLHGASSYHRRELMAPYLMHWRAMQYAKARGCRLYDLGGVAPSDDPGHSFHGLHRFKTGFGGYIVHDSGSWDFPVNPSLYQAFRNWEMTTVRHEAVGAGLG